MFTKLIFRFMGSAQQTFVVAGILASAIAIYLTWRLGRNMFGQRAGVCAAMLLLFNPPFWFGASSNQVRVFLAVGGAAITLGFWHSLRQSSPVIFYVTAALVGVLSGFRPEMIVFAAPMVIYAAARGHRTLAQSAVAFAIAALTTATWAAFVVHEVGG